MKSTMEMSKMEISERDGYADFLKTVLIYTVVLGHFIGLYQYKTGLEGGLYSWIYSFHMPLFVFISGYFSKNIYSLRRKNIDTILFPLVVFQIINIFYTAIIPDEPLIGNVFYPYHQNWYLIALFWWRTFIPYRHYFNPIVVIIVSFALCLGAGFFSEWGVFLGLYKTAYFLPFFVMGVYCDDLAKLLSHLSKHKVFWITILVVSSAIVFLLSFNKSTLSIMNFAFKANLGYDGHWLKLIYRLFAICTSILMGLSMLFVLKKIYNRLDNIKLCWFSGGGTMLAFLVHEFIMIPLIRFYWQFGYYGFVLCVITSLIVTYVLTRKFLVNLFSPLLDLSVMCKKMHIQLYKEDKKIN